VSDMRSLVGIDTGVLDHQLAVGGRLFGGQFG
jgi:hypothetical protein